MEQKNCTFRIKWINTRVKSMLTVTIISLGEYVSVCCYRAARSHFKRWTIINSQRKGFSVWFQVLSVTSARFYYVCRYSTWFRLYTHLRWHYDMRDTVFGFLRASFWHSVVLLSQPSLSCQTISVKCVGWALLIQLHGMSDLVEHNIYVCVVSACNVKVRMLERVLLTAI